MSGIQISLQQPYDVLSKYFFKNKPELSKYIWQLNDVDALLH